MGLLLELMDRKPHLSYHPLFLLTGSILATIGAGLIYTFSLTSGLGPIIGFRTLYCTGTDLSVQMPVVVAGALSSTQDQPVPTATVLCMSKYIPDTNSQPTDLFTAFRSAPQIRSWTTYF